MISRLCTPAYRGLRVHDSRLRPNQTLVSYTLAGLVYLAKLNFFKTPASGDNLPIIVRLSCKHALYKAHIQLYIMYI